MSLAPPVPVMPSGAEWRLAAQFGPPDLIIRSDPYDVPASGLDNWWPHEVQVEGLDGPAYNDSGGRSETSDLEFFCCWTNVIVNVTVAP